MQFITYVDEFVYVSSSNSRLVNGKTRIGQIKRFRASAMEGFRRRKATPKY